MSSSGALSSRIDPTAIVSESAKLGAHVSIGPYSIVGARAELGDRCRIGARVSVDYCKLGADVRIGDGTLVGGPPEMIDVGDDVLSHVQIGDRTRVSELVTIHRSAAVGESTLIGADVYIMTRAHIAHDCQIGDGAVIGAFAGLAGSVTVGAKAHIGGRAGIHQKTRIGAMAMVGAMSALRRDVPPYFLIAPKVDHSIALNLVGMRRAGVSPSDRAKLKKARSILLEDGILIDDAIARIKSEIESSEAISDLIEFLSRSDRGFKLG